MDYSDFADIDRELEDLGSVPVPEHLSRIVAQYGGWGLELDDVDEMLNTMEENAIPQRDSVSSDISRVGFGEVEPVPEVQDEPEAEVIAGDPYEVFQDDIDDNVAQEVFVEAESQGLIQRVSELPEVSVSDEAASVGESEQVEFSDVRPDELTTIDEDGLELKTASESERHSFAEFIDESGQNFATSDDQSASAESVEQAAAAEPEFDAVYFHEAEEELPATEELRAYRESEFDQYDDDVAYASERPPEEQTRERSPFRDSEYKRLLELELDPSDFPQSEPTSSQPSSYEAAADVEFEALDDDDIVELEDEDIEIGDETDGAVVSVDDAEVQEEIIETNEDDSHR